MFKAMIAVCVISQFNVEGKSSCFLVMSEDLWPSFLSCMQANESKRSMIHMDFMQSNRKAGAVVSQLGCKEEKSL